MLGLCDDRDRIAARIYATVRFAVDKSAREPDPPHDCPCCAFYRGGLLFGVLGLALGIVLVCVFR